MDKEEKEPETIRNREEIKASKIAGCMLCTSVYDARLVIDYTDNGQTALCPICGLDSVVGDACGITIDETSIAMLNDKFCGGYRIPKGKKYRNIIVK